MKKLVSIAFLLCGVYGGLAGQEVTHCSCDTGTCVAEAEWGRRESSFTLPLGALAGLLPGVSPVAGLFIPDLEITLHESLFGTMRVGLCPDPCCHPGRTLRAATDVLLSGTTVKFGLPPTPASVTAVVRASDVTDNGPGDMAPGVCEIVAPFDIPAGGVRVSLVLLGNVQIPLYSSVTGEVAGRARVSCSCEGKPNAPPAISLPAVVMVPIGGETRFPIGVNDPDGDPVWIYTKSGLDWLTVAFDFHKGEGIVRAAPDAPVDMKAAVIVVAYDLRLGAAVTGDRPRREQFYHEVPYSFNVRTVRNNPPRAISTTTTIKHAELIEKGVVAVELAADDPDLRRYPDNFGYDYWFAWPSPFFSPAHWACGCPWIADLSPLDDKCMQPAGKLPRVSLFCGPTSIEVVIWEGTRGISWTGPFTVVEIKGRPFEFGFASSGTVTLIVNNKPPQLTVAPSQVTVRPGDAVTARVTATDSDGDRIELAQTGGPGTFPPVSGSGMVSGTWSWTVPAYYAYGPSWEIVTFLAHDRWGGRDYATLVIWILRPLRVHASPVTVSRGRTAWGSVYVDDGDPSPIRMDFLPVSIEFSPPPGISVVERPEIQPSGLGTYVPVEVTVARELCPGTYAVPFRATHLVDRRSASGTLHVTVVGNQPPQVRGELRGETAVTLTPGGAVYGPVVMRVPVHDPDGDRVYLEGFGRPPTYAAEVSLYLGFLVAVYGPYPETGDGFCRAVREART